MKIEKQKMKFENWKQKFKENDKWKQKMKNEKVKENWKRKDEEKKVN